MNIVKNQLENFLNQYSVWKAGKQFYENSKLINLQDFLQLPCFHYTEIDNINKCDSNTIVIDNITESIHSSKYFKEYDIEKYYIIFSSGWWDKSKHNIGLINYDNINCWFFVFDMVDTYNSPNKFCFHLKKTYSFNYPKQNLFCSTIGNKRPLRDIIVKKIKNKFRTNDYILRYSGEDYGIPSNHLDVVNFTKGNFDPYTQILPEYFHNVSQTIPIKIYNESYLNLVVESDLDIPDSFFITEKTIKALITGIPFIVIASPNFLKTLHQYGFRTFDVFWDESYDLEENYELRLDKIMHLIKSLSTFDWEKNKKELEYIVAHNFRNITTLNTISDKIFNNFEQIVEKYNDSRC